MYSQGLDSTTMYCVCTHTRTWQQNHVLCVYSHNDLIAQPCIVCTHKDLTAQPCIVCGFTRGHDSKTMYYVCIHTWTWQHSHVLCICSHDSTDWNFSEGHHSQSTMYCTLMRQKGLAWQQCHALCVFKQSHYHIAMHYVYSTKDMTT